MESSAEARLGLDKNSPNNRSSCCGIGAVSPIYTQVESSNSLIAGGGYLKRGALLSIALIISGLANLLMLWIQLALIFKIFILTHVSRWADLAGWFGTFATVIIVLSSISDKSISRHHKLIKVVGIIVVCLVIVQFLTNRIYASFQIHHFI